MRIGLAVVLCGAVMAGCGGDDADSGVDTAQLDLAAGQAVSYARGQASALIAAAQKREYGEARLYFARIPPLDPSLSDALEQTDAALDAGGDRLVDHSRELHRLLLGVRPQPRAVISSIDALVADAAGQSQLARLRAKVEAAEALYAPFAALVREQDAAVADAVGMAFTRLGRRLDRNGDRRAVQDRILALAEALRPVDDVLIRPEG